MNQEKVTEFAKGFAGSGDILEIGDWCLGFFIQHVSLSCICIGFGSPCPGPYTLFLHNVFVHADK